MVHHGNNNGGKKRRNRKLTKCKGRKKEMNNYRKSRFF